jgi:cell division septum initiation protein DivIVA
MRKSILILSLFLYCLPVFADEISELKAHVDTLKKQVATQQSIATTHQVQI